MNSERSGLFYYQDDVRTYSELQELVAKILQNTTKSIDKRMQFSISHYRQLQYSSAMKGCVTASEYIDGLIKTTFLL